MPLASGRGTGVLVGSSPRITLPCHICNSVPLIGGFGPEVSHRSELWPLAALVTAWALGDALPRPSQYEGLLRVPCVVGPVPTAVGCAVATAFSGGAPVHGMGTAEAVCASQQDVSCGGVGQRAIPPAPPARVNGELRTGGHKRWGLCGQRETAHAPPRDQRGAQTNN